MKTPKSPDNRDSLRVIRKASRPQSPLVNSPAEAEREIAQLQRWRQDLESRPTVAETYIRTSIP